MKVYLTKDANNKVEMWRLEPTKAQRNWFDPTNQYEAYLYLGSNVDVGIELNQMEYKEVEITFKEILKPESLEERISKYRRSNIFDINGKEILEGSIINADGYDSDLEKHVFQCVFYDNAFFSNIYGDADPLNMYQQIEVVGHAEEYRDVYEHGGDWSGNLGEGLK